jgi:hypothetical protein
MHTSHGKPRNNEVIAKLGQPPGLRRLRISRPQAPSGFPSTIAICYCLRKKFANCFAGAKTFSKGFALRFQSFVITSAENDLREASHIL